MRHIAAFIGDMPLPGPGQCMSILPQFPYFWAEGLLQASMGKEKGGKKGGGSSKPEHMTDEEWELCQNVAELVMVRRFNPVLSQKSPRLRAVGSHVVCVLMGMGR